MSSTLRSLRARIEQEVQERLVPELMVRAIQYHTRRGLRNWCDCSFCQEKKRGTRYISCIPIPRHVYQDMPQHADYYEVNEIIHDRIWKLRKDAAKALRKVLEQRKQEVVLCENTQQQKSVTGTRFPNSR